MPKEMSIADELLNMEKKLVKLSHVYLDPNNPRLETPDKAQKVPESRVCEPGVQAKCMQRLKEEIGIYDLTESIRSAGFWTIDRVVLKLLDSNKYVVVEGNRRITALKSLQQAHEDASLELPENILKGILEFEALIYKGNHPDIAWIIQGFRHTPGIKMWKEYPQAKFLATFSKNNKKTLAEVASIFGIKKNKITHLIRAYYAFEHAKEDDDYGDELTADKFGHFDEIIMGTKLKEWMEWNETKMKFSNTNNLKKYLSWIVPIEGDKPRFTISTLARDTLIELIKPEHKKLFDKFENGGFSIEECKKRLDRDEEEKTPVDIEDTINDLEATKKILTTLPIPQLQRAKTLEDKSQKVRLIDVLEEIIAIIKLQISNLKK